MKENETDITEINHLIYAATTVITETITKPSKTEKNTLLENENAKTNKQLGKELSVLAESCAGSDNIKLNIKRELFSRNTK